MPLEEGEVGAVEQVALVAEDDGLGAGIEFAELVGVEPGPLSVGEEVLLFVVHVVGDLRRHELAERFDDVDVFPSSTQANLRLSGRNNL